MTVAEHNGMALVYDTEDVASISLSAPHDVEESERDGVRHLELGTAHLHLNIDFLPGKRAWWVGPEEKG